ncbi:hypothetical protein BLNAU_21295 [Blattamonas nauphoetae]|uniref:Uncharacterized protein n=1 Tax=Blattamonas nauphoetae TaxID=2049346 RepID=A0ABQ9WW98_9EUKA|nr:hypothetical protein BLNAU_21295 [Blattamonas nauphoetae]
MDSGASPYWRQESSNCRKNLTRRKDVYQQSEEELGGKNFDDSEDKTAAKNRKSRESFSISNKDKEKEDRPTTIVSEEKKERETPNKTKEVTDVIDVTLTITTIDSSSENNTHTHIGHPQSACSRLPTLSVLPAHSRIGTSVFRG